MAYPYNRPLNEVTGIFTAPTVVSGQNGAIRVPFRSRLMEVGTILGSAAATADATVGFTYLAAGSTTATSIAGTSAMTVASTLSQAGKVTSAEPTETVILEKDSGIIVAVTGSSTSGGNVTHYATFREA